VTRRLASISVIALLALAGCGSGEDATTAGETSAPNRAPGPAREKASPVSDRLAPSHCPPGLPACRTTAGLIVYVERVDPDGDGDANFVVADPQGITLPGLTAIDVRKGLRPDPLPGVGVRIGAAGPVQRGSYGQSQIHAIELHVAGE
jgi:hypothetical protein